MLIVVALAFPVVLVLAPLVMSWLEHRLERDGFTIDVDRYLRDLAADERAESDIAAQAQRLLSRARR